MRGNFSDRVSFASTSGRVLHRVALVLVAVATVALLTSCHSASEATPAPAAPAAAATATPTTTTDTSGQTAADIDASSGTPYNVPVANVILWTRGMNSKNIYVCLVDQNPADSPFTDQAVSWDLSLLTSKLTKGFKTGVVAGNQYAVFVNTLKTCTADAHKSETTPHIIIVKN